MSKDPSWGSRKDIVIVLPQRKRCSEGSLKGSNRYEMWYCTLSQASQQWNPLWLQIEDLGGESHIKSSEGSIVLWSRVCLVLLFISGSTSLNLFIIGMMAHRQLGVALYGISQLMHRYSFTLLCHVIYNNNNIIIIKVNCENIRWKGWDYAIPFYGSFIFSHRYQRNNEQERSSKVMHDIMHPY